MNAQDYERLARAELRRSALARKYPTGSDVDAALLALVNSFEKFLAVMRHMYGPCLVAALSELDATCAPDSEYAALNEWANALFNKHGRVTGADFLDAEARAIHDELLLRYVSNDELDLNRSMIPRDTPMHLTARCMIHRDSCLQSRQYKVHFNGSVVTHQASLKDAMAYCGLPRLESWKTY